MSKKWAFLVGIQKYEYLSPLSYAAADAQLLAGSLRTACGFDPDQITLVTDSSSNPGRMLTNREIIRRLAWYKGHVEPNDTFLFYFAGHGFMSREERSYLAGIDAEDNEHVAKTGAISLEDIKDALDDIPARQRIIICDCCRNRREVSRGSDDNPLTEKMAEAFDQLLDRGIRAKETTSQVSDFSSAVLLACKPGQRAYESHELKHGVFTYMLAEALEKPTVNKNNELDLDLIVASVRSGLKKWAAEKPHELMEPHFAEVGQVVLGVATPPEEAPPDPVRIERMALVNRHLLKKELLAARAALKKGPELNVSEQELLAEIQHAIEKQSPYCFRKGASATTLKEWLVYLQEHPDTAAEELQDDARIRKWLTEIQDRPDLAELAEKLRSPHDSQWLRLEDFAWRANILDPKVLDGLHHQAVKVQQGISETEKWVQTGNLHEASSSLGRVEKIDPNSKRVRDAREVIKQQTIPSRNSDTRWQEWIDQAVSLFQKGEIPQGIVWLQRADQMRSLPSEVLERLQSLSPIPQGLPGTKIVKGVEYVRLPAGIFVSEAKGLSPCCIGLSEFWISRSPISVENYRSVMGRLPMFAPEDNPNFAVPTKPIVMVSWDSAMSFCRQIGTILPSEAQWEYARRFALNWPKIGEWCRDVFVSQRSTTPAFNPVTTKMLGTGRTVRSNLPEERYDRIWRLRESIAENVGFRCVLPEQL